MRRAPQIAAGFLALVALAHLARVVFHVEVLIGGRVVPPWMSLAAFLFCGLLAGALLRRAR